MQFSAKPSRNASVRGKRAPVYAEVVSRYAQDMMMQQTDTNGGQTLNPDELQKGQPVYDQQGKEYVVLSDPSQDNGSDQKILMPSDQSGSGVPQGVTTVDNSDLASQYQMTSPQTDQKIQSHRADVHMNLPAGYGGKASPSKEKDASGLRVGQEGYVDIMNSIRDMVDAGYDTVDVILNIGELYDRDMGERVLQEARERGIL